MSHLAQTACYISFPKYFLHNTVQVMHNTNSKSYMSYWKHHWFVIFNQY